VHDDKHLLPIVLPPLAGALLWLGVLAASAITGAHPIWPMEPGNLAEAAALRDGGDLVRRAEAGEDVNRAAAVRARLVTDNAAVITPLEAAAGARDEAMVQLLFDLGAAPDAAAWQRAFCISDADSVREILKEHMPPDAEEVCAGE
jgi:hypothetical protein